MVLLTETRIDERTGKFEYRNVKSEKSPRGASEIGGVADHIHMLLGLRATHTLADVLRDTKSVSSSWVHDEIRSRSFAWQEGYGAFTVSASQLNEVRAYIENQEEHHRTITFREEYIGFLESHGIEFDERYLW